MELLERETILSELGQLWNEARGGDGRIVFLGGEAGVGKSQVIRAFERSMLPPTRVLAGYCDALSTPRPLGPLFDMVTGTDSDIERLINNGASRNALFPAVLTEIKKSPALVVVEDAHWADEATLDLLRYLGRRVDQCPALVLVTYRDDETGRDHPVTLLLGDLATAPAVRRMTIRPLSEKAVAALAGDREIDIGELYRKTGGNPFYVTEILSAGGSGVPATVRDAVLARVNRLSAAAGATLGVAAVIGPAIESWLLAEVAGEPRAIDECIASGMLVVAGDGRYAFRHELAREAIAGATPVERLRSHHHKVLLALEEQDNAETYLVRLAYHAEAIGDAERVLRYGRDAAEQARSVSAHREAAAQLLRAHRFSSHLPNVERAILLESLAFECHAISSLQQGVEARDAAIQLWRAEGDQLRVAENLSRKASMLVLASRNSEAEEASAMALEIIRELPEHPIHGMVYRVHGNLRMLNRDTTEAVEWGERAIAVGERFGDLEVVLAAEDAIGAALLVAGQVEEGTWRLERNFENAMKAGLDSVAASSINNLGSGAGEVHEFRIARGYLDRAIEYSRERDQDMGRLYSESWLALCQLHLGEWQAAGESALAVLREMNAPGIARTMALIALGRLRTRRGDPGVWESLDEALALAEPTRTLQRIAPVRAARAEAAWTSGNPGRCAEEASAAYSLAVEHEHAWFLGELAYWQWKAGALESIPPAAAEPYLLQMSGKWETAEAAWDAKGCRYEAARALEESGDEDAMKKALRMFDLLGARPAMAMTIKSLRNLGARQIPRGPRPSTRGNPANLTGREADVLDLLMAGRTNRAIAEALFLSPKTVERHVSAILAKLDSSTRQEAVARARELGISTSPN